MTSLTTELYGILATVITALVIALLHEDKITSKASILIVSDNPHAIKMATSAPSIINISDTLQPEYDIQALLHMFLLSRKVAYAHS